jgi:hypothetical protein
MEHNKSIKLLEMTYKWRQNSFNMLEGDARYKLAWMVKDTFPIFRQIIIEEVIREIRGDKPEA